jgi:23S rRNA pseudouridine2605 synthase
MQRSPNEKGIKLEDGMTSPATVKKVRKAEANSWVEITIHEGRKHQVKRMLEAVGHPVIKLTRVKMGPLTLGDLGSGEFRFLTDREANALRDIVEQRRTLEKEGKDPGVRPPAVSAGRSPRNQTAPTETRGMKVRTHRCVN